MSNSLTRFAVFAALALGSLALPAPSFSQELELRVGPDGIRPVIRERERIRDQGCSPREARAAALDEGLRRPQVVRITDRSVTVEGFTRYGPERIRFANRRGCPII